MSSVDIQSSEATMRQEESREPTEETRTAVEEAQAPSGWETLNPEPGTPEEKPKTEEGQAQTTLDALEEIPKIMEELEKDSSRYDAHVRLIELLKQVDLPDQLEAARERMHQVYPLSESLWLDWINDAKKEANTEEGEQRLRALYEEAEKDYYSISIWKSFVDYVLEKFDARWGDEETGPKDEAQVADIIETTREDLLKAVRATRYDIAKSHEIWNPFINFERQVLERFRKPEQYARVKDLYLDRLQVLHLAIQETFNGFSNLISSWDNDNYENIMVEVNKTFSSTKAAVNEREPYERQLAENGYAVDYFYQYIENEKVTKNMFSLNHVRNLYERALAIYCTDVGLWDDYILFLMEKARAPAFMETVANRAVRNCPWSGILWAHLARILELKNTEKEQVFDIFDRALGNPSLLSSLEDLVALFKAKCDYLRHQINWEEPDDISNEDLQDLQLAFEEALSYISDEFPETMDPYYRIEQYYAYIMAVKMGNQEKGREIWEEVILRQGRNVEAWLQYINFERMLGNIAKCESLFKRAIVKQLDYPERLMDAWIRMEHEVGSVDSTADALIRINRKTKSLTREWQAAIAQQEEAEERKKEKEIQQKRQKAQRRIQQKEKQKERKKSQASESAEHPPKRKLSETGEERPSKATKTEQEPKARPSRGRGRGRGRIGLGYRGRGGRGDGTPTAESSESQETRPSTSEAAPKSNQDFRAMLLGKK